MVRINILVATVVFLLGCTPASKNSDASIASQETGWLGKSSLSTALRGDGKIQIFWKTSQPEINHFIFRSQTATAGYKLIGKTVGALGFLDGTSIDPATPYYYRVFAHPILQPLDSDANSSGAYSVIGITDSCLDKTILRTIKTTSDLPTLETQLTTIYQNCSSIISAKINQPLSTNDLKAVFSMFMSHALAPYGHSSKSHLFDLLTERQLDCDNYGLLAGHLYEVLAGSTYTEDWALVGFDKGAVGNHAQIAYHSATNDMILDPTTGLVAFVSYTDLMNGKALTDDKVHSLYLYIDDPRQPVSLRNYHWKIQNALTDGLYKASDYLYFETRIRGQF
jgi:hypothetical protein